MSVLLKNLIIAHRMRLSISSYPIAAGLITYNHATPPVRQAGIHSYLATAEIRIINR